MKFKMARCIACNNYITDISRLLAFRRVCLGNDPTHLDTVDLHGDEPWAGVMIICVDCLDFFGDRCKERAMIEPRMEDTPHDRPLDDPPETQESIGEWANATFGGSGDPLSSRHCIRLLEEVVELCLAAGASRYEVSDAVHREVNKNRPFPDEVSYRDSWYDSYPSISKVPEEMADCEIVLRVLAHRRDVDLQAEVDKKMRINRLRRWKLNNDGTGYHVKEGE